MSGTGDHSTEALVREAQRALGAVLAPSPDGLADADDARARAQEAYDRLGSMAQAGDPIAQQECYRVLVDQAVSVLPINPVSLLLGVDPQVRAQAFAYRGMSGDQLIAVTGRQQLDELRPEAFRRLFLAAKQVNNTGWMDHLLSQPDANRTIHTELLNDPKLRRRFGLTRPRILAMLTPAELAATLNDTWDLAELRTAWKLLADVPRRRVLAPLIRARALTARDHESLMLLARAQDAATARAGCEGLVDVIVNEAMTIEQQPSTMTERWIAEATETRQGLRSIAAVATVGDQPWTEPLEQRWNDADHRIGRALATARVALATQRLRELFAVAPSHLPSWQRAMEHRCRVLAQAMDHPDAPPPMPFATELLTYAQNEGVRWARMRPNAMSYVLPFEQDVVCPHCAAWRPSTWRYCGACGSPNNPRTQ